jgi:nucleoside-diphosphate-sugar epimerase
MLEAAVQNGVARFVYVSSAAVHSFIDVQDMDEQSPQLPTPFPYCQSKREAETLVLGYHERKKITTTIVRPGDVYGPGDRVALLRLSKLLESGLMAYVGQGEKLGAFTYVENLADGLILVGTVEQAAGEVYVITDGVRLTWRDYFEKLTSALGVPRPRISVSPALAWAIASTLESAYHLFCIRRRPPITRYLVTHLSKDFYFSIDKARRELGYEPRVGIDEAIEQTAKWYKEMVQGK